MKHITILLLLIFCYFGASAQDTSDSTLVQFSGLILDGTDESLYPVPYTNILIKEEGRGTYSDLKGFFSLVANKGDVVVFSAIGYETVEFVIPDTLTDNRYSLVQLMSEDVYNLPETVVFPWPSRDHFKLEFLAMDVTSELQEYAASNMAENTLVQMREVVQYDGNENADFYMRQQAKNYYHYGQTPPMNIFNPFAWKQFFEAWKNGEFKNKKK